MSDESMTREQVKELVESVVENVALKFEHVLSIKFEEYGEKQKEEQRLARETVFETGTGIPWKDRDKLKDILTNAHAAQKNALLWKSAGVITIAGLLLKDLWRIISPS